MAIFKSHLYTLPAYKPPLEGRDPSSHLLLDFNERTLPLGESVRKALIDYINGGRMQMYPSYGDIVERIAAYVGVRSEQVMITNGSDQGIELVFRASCMGGDEAIIPAPSFAMYTQCAKIEGLHIHEPHFDIVQGFPTQEVLEKINQNTRIICIANPNNPSGTRVDRDDIIKIAQAAPDTSILVDECYFEYAKDSVVDLIDEFPNIVVTRTFSKTWGIPSLRFGYLIASEENVKALLSVRGPYDINQLAIVAVRAALENPSYTNDYVDEVMSQSKPELENFLRENSIVFWPSNANYIWAFPPRAMELAESLAKQGILVRPKADSDGVMGLRITLGSLDQTRRLIRFLNEFI